LFSNIVHGEPNHFSEPFTKMQMCICLMTRCLLWMHE